MILSTPEILRMFPHVFNNEWNQREIIYKTIFQSNPYSRYLSSDKTFLTKDKNGIIEAVTFFQSPNKPNQYGYSFLNAGCLQQIKYEYLHKKIFERGKK